MELNYESVSPERLVSLLNYNPHTGLFIWKERAGDDAVTRRWNSNYAGKPAGCSSGGSGYIRISIDGCSYQSHRIAWAMFHGRWPTSYIDHISGDKHDNRIANLREASPEQNSRNSKVSSRNSSGFKGVSWHKKDKYWRAVIHAQGKQIRLGTFDNPESAARAYEQASIKYHGAYRRCS